MNFLISHLDTIIIAIVAIILGYDRFRSGASSIRKEIIADYKERNDQLDAKIKDLEDKHQKNLIELASIRAIIEEKDKRIAELRDDLLGRNPAILDLLKEISVSNLEIKNFMQMMHNTISKETRHQTDILEGQVKRERSIDESSETGKGSPMRTPSK